MYALKEQRCCKIRQRQKWKYCKQLLITNVFMKKKHSKKQEIIQIKQNSKIYVGNQIS